MRAERSAARPREHDDRLARGVARSFAGIALVVCSLVFTSSAAAFTFDVPKPTGFVVDRVGVLDARTKARIETVNEELRRKTGAEIAVVIVPTTEPEPIFDYAMAVAEAWKPGARDKDNGVVFVVAVQDRQMYILTGYGAEGVLPDGKVGDIRDEIVAPAFRKGDYAGGVWNAVATMASLIAGDAGVTLDGAPPPPRARERSSGSGISALIVLVVIFLVLRGMFRGRRSGFRGRRGRGLADDLGPFILGNILGRGFGGRGHGGFGGGGFGGSFGGGRGGFGGFGGGSFGGGGAGGSW